MSDKNDKSIDKLQDVKSLLEDQSEKLEILQQDNRAVTRSVKECLEPYKKVGLLSVEDDPFFKEIQAILAVEKHFTTPEIVMYQLEGAPDTTRILRRVRNIMKHLGWKSKIIYDKEKQQNKRVWVCGN